MADVLRSDRLPGPNVRAIFAAVSAALVLIVACIWLLRWFVSPSTLAAPITWVVVLVLVPNVTVACWSGTAPLALLALCFAANIAGATAGIHFGGGADQVSGPLLYAILIGLAGVLVSGRAAFLTAGGSAFAYGVMAWAEYRALLPHLVDYRRPPDRQAATVCMVGIYLFLLAWLVSYVVRQVRAGYQLAEELRAEAVSALSHDLKNPLGIISGYAQMLEEATPTERADYVRRIEHSTRQALDLVTNVLDTAAETRLVAHRLPVQLNTVVAQVVESSRLAADGKGVRLTAVLAEDLPSIDADAQLLGRAVGNLLSNAIKYAPTGSVVRVETAADRDEVVVTVSDDGCGIAPADQAQLFEKYSRVYSGQNVEGTGLGLYIVRRIAEGHDGSVSVRSALGKGSVFTLRLPIGHAS
jgi:signal transduction histidine kinase